MNEMQDDDRDESAVDALTLPITQKSYDPMRSLAFLMSRNAKLAMALADKAFAEDGGLGFGPFISLMLLRQGVAGSPGELASWLGINSGVASRLADRLERGGFIRRSRNKRDRRSVALQLTPKGDQEVEIRIPRMVVLWNAVLSDFEPTEYRMLVMLLEKLSDALQATGCNDSLPSPKE